MAEDAARLKKKLSGGDMRSIGRVPEVIEDALANPANIPILIQMMVDESPLIRMRASDAVEKLCASNPAFIQPYKEFLINHVAKIPQQEVRWHFAQIVPRLKMDETEKQVVVSVLMEYLGDKSKIVVVSAMDALAKFALEDADLRSKVVPILEDLTEHGSSALQSRGRKLLRLLGKR
ncbi:MAG: hypothetical protein J7L73_06610 [Anaerolineales bacterium]|nr:hypothetical protein [Anaerolineales bacterium]